MYSNAVWRKGLRKPNQPAVRPSGWQLFNHNRLARLGMWIFVCCTVLACLAPILPIPDPNATALVHRLAKPWLIQWFFGDMVQNPPVFEGWLGTDHLGRDLLSRVLWGTQISLLVGGSATLVAALIGSLLGLVAGFWGGRIDNLLMRGIDMLMAFPYILLALAIVAVLGAGLMNALFAIAIVNIPFFARNVRGVTLGVVRQPFVEAAQLVGKNRWQTLCTDVLPNVMPTIVITMATTLGWMILETAGLSFLGLGAQPPQADLGSMLGEGRKLLFTAPHVSIIPGLIIFILVMSINLIGDGIRDVLDPRLKSGVMGRPAAATNIRCNREADEFARPEVQGLIVNQLQTEFQLGHATYQAVNNVSLTLEAGECLGLVGESGSGKSVLALSIARLVPSPPGCIVHGQVWQDTQDLLSIPLAQLQHIRGNKVAYVFQDPATALHPMLTVGSQLVEAIRAHRPISYRQAWQQAVNWLERVQIPNPGQRVHSYPYQLSGGMRQRVVIAMALINQPKVLIADEPTTALDVTVQAQILKLLKQLQQDTKAALLFITHDFGVVTTLCERIAVMYAGQIVEMGYTTDVLNHPAHPYTHQLIKCIPKLGGEGALATIDGLPPAMNALPPGCHFAPRCPWAETRCKESTMTLKAISNSHWVRCCKPL
ncbi:dipeptide/oligopeptide/nickel ABC transporter permease/ATP-binding protein [Zooshikella harenae]|uniref:Dipeptide/oligopeptide/nickel ABC transporter permease/ATP-binding protein n=1 Tax=Zooshikella harenae TaxID=2827238 RepID=A0ABS5ZFY6_9GAMM|nr:dipeptide/oligopeptide/nickel ABC transporter permease/ATP-binding protein [Zooshikella harenae]MBU2712959.1 dipeptide/oligopeptide/nickel ABC transporter permease/ATP-binding protein [Zooshikella harenae]